MTPPRAYIAGFGIATALGRGSAETLAALEKGSSALSPIGLFCPPGGDPLPVGQVAGLEAGPARPRTHRLADIAAEPLLAPGGPPPDAVVLGTTTGGMDATEPLLRDDVTDPEAYRHHGAGTVAADLARRLGCTGPVLTVSTACSSGAAAVALASALIRSGRAARVVAGGADALCRLTYYGFSSLQLLDPAGARPLDRYRRGMSVAEGAALVMLTAGTERPICEIVGAGLSCDAWHPASPHPEGAGARSAMERALLQAGLRPADIDYINLHGTGTIDNDLAEARAIRSLFGGSIPPLSSVKGAMGHSLAASGAVETVIAALAVDRGIMPASTGFRHPDPALGLDPLRSPRKGQVRAVLNNAFGFGGSNAVVVAGEPQRFSPPAYPSSAAFHMASGVCITGAGATEETLASLAAGVSCSGRPDEDNVCRHLDPRQIRRLRRLPRLALSLAAAAGTKRVGSVFFGTGWGALSETDRFLQRLFETRERYPSPTDFVGSVHNAPAGQIAQFLGARGANLTLTGETDPFEQALLAAELVCTADDDPVLLVAADEAHDRLSPLFDPAAADRPADGGGALLLEKSGCGPSISVAFFAGDGLRTGAAADLCRAIGGPDAGVRFGAVLAGVPAAAQSSARRQLRQVLDACRLRGPVIDFRRWVGQFAAASAVAAVAAGRWVARGRLPKSLCEGADPDLGGRGILLLGLGASITAVEVLPG